VNALPLRALAPAKINLGLFLGPARADGRHELATVMQSISLADELTLTAADPAAAADSADPADSAAATDSAAAGAGRTAGGGGELATAHGDVVVCPGVVGAPGDNLAARALAAFREATDWYAPPLRLSILKRVPVAAGLGGGSGDAAAALRLAAAASGLGDEELLAGLARTLGADVPAQVQPGRWLAGGAGEVLRQLPDPVVPLGVLVLPVARALSTADVYVQADRMGLARDRVELGEAHRELAAALADGSPLPPAQLLRNDLEEAARALCPEIDAALLEARSVEADAALLSGSGPTVLGLFAGSRGPARARAGARALAERVPAPIAADPVVASFARPTASR
jgi:4-diphosphocytidyl-2-C-methyl-D-erythritol kinase